MSEIISQTPHPVALITGSSKRIGEALARHLHQQNYNVVIHCNTSIQQAQVITDELNTLRDNSAHYIQANLIHHADTLSLAEQALAKWSRLDVLINNASSFYATPLPEATESHWDELFNSNLKAPFFLSKTLAPALKKAQGTIINLCDIHAIRPLQQHAIYCASKAGLIMLTKSLALELAPDVRVNGIAPGAILWPEDQAWSEQHYAEKLSAIPLAKKGQLQDIINAAWFLIQEAHYMTGQILPIDGGRTLRQ